MIKCNRLVLFSVVVGTGCTVMREAPEPGKAEVHSKQVLLQEGGKERHWVIKSGSLIVEEHYLTAHGDFHVVVEYPTGVRSPQVDSPQREMNLKTVVRGFWPNGKPMSATPEIGDKPNGPELVWWPDGRLAREARFTLGIPSGEWKFYDISGKHLDEGKYQDGKRWSGTFVGNDTAGADFILRGDLRKQTFENGDLKHEGGLADEEFLEKHFSKELDTNDQR